jgi:hypothetical protein
MSIESRAGAALTRMAEIFLISSAGSLENSRPPVLEARGEVYPAISHQCHVSVVQRVGTGSADRFLLLVVVVETAGRLFKNFGSMTKEES